jgi:hypothetical protein
MKVRCNRIDCEFNECGECEPDNREISIDYYDGCLTYEKSEKAPPRKERDCMRIAKEKSE